MSAQEHAAIVRDVLLGRDHWKDGIAALDALVADNERLTARVEQFERHVETVIEPKLLRRAEEAEAEVERLKACDWADMKDRADAAEAEAARWKANLQRIADYGCGCAGCTIARAALAPEPKP